MPKRNETRPQEFFVDKDLWTKTDKLSWPTRKVAIYLRAVAGASDLAKRRPSGIAKATSLQIRTVRKALARLTTWTGDGEQPFLAVQHDGTIRLRPLVAKPGQRRPPFIRVPFILWDAAIPDDCKDVYCFLDASWGRGTRRACKYGRKVPSIESCCCLTGHGGPARRQRLRVILQDLFDAGVLSEIPNKSQITGIAIHPENLPALVQTMRAGSAPDVRMVPTEKCAGSALEVRKVRSNPQTSGYQTSGFQASCFQTSFQKGEAKASKEPREDTEPLTREGRFVSVASLLNGSTDFFVSSADFWQEQESDSAYEDLLASLEAEPSGLSNPETVPAAKYDLQAIRTLTERDGRRTSPPEPRENVFLASKAADAASGPTRPNMVNGAKENPRKTDWTVYGPNDILDHIATLPQTKAGMVEFLGFLEDKGEFFYTHKSKFPCHHGWANKLLSRLKDLPWEYKDLAWAARDGRVSGLKDQCWATLTTDNVIDKYIASVESRIRKRLANAT